MNLPHALDWRLAAIKNGMQDALAYRINFVVELVFSALTPVAVQLILWQAYFQGGTSDRLGQLTHAELIQYSLASLLFSQIRGGNYDFTLIEMIRNGTLSIGLLRPVGPVEFTYFRSFGEKAFVTGIALTAGVVTCAFTQYSVVHLLLGMIVAWLGNVIAYVFGSILATVAFYWENAFAVLIIKNTVVAFLSGEVIPLTLFPEKLSFLWQSLPFYFFVHAPTQIFLGKWGNDQIQIELFKAVVWLVVLLFIHQWVWKRNIHKYQAIGG